MQLDKIITKLKKQLAAKGYVENFGQKELREYKDYASKHFNHLEAHNNYVQLSKEIDAL